MEIKQTLKRINQRIEKLETRRLDTMKTLSFANKVKNSPLQAVFKANLERRLGRVKAELEMAKMERAVLMSEPTVKMPYIDPQSLETKNLKEPSLTIKGDE